MCFIRRVANKSAAELLDAAAKIRHDFLLVSMLGNFCLGR